jgi:hypothetical protein
MGGERSGIVSTSLGQTIADAAMGTVGRLLGSSSKNPIFFVARRATKQIGVRRNRFPVPRKVRETLGR